VRPVLRQVDAAYVVLTWLRSVIGIPPVPPAAAGVVFLTKYPAARDLAGPVVRLRRSGGTVLPTLEDSPRLDVQVRHEDDAGRMAVALWVRSLLLAAPGAVVDMADGTVAIIGRVTEFVGPGQFPDPEDTSREIVMFTVEVRLRGRAA
jgi:hypothetical protein